MGEHRGRIVKNIIQKCGYSISKLAEKLKMQRSTLNKKLQNPLLSYELIDNIGQCIFYDFSTHFSDFQSTHQFSIQERKKVILEQKYTELLEKYKSLLELTVKVADTSHIQSMKNKKILE